jgi:hypothetical protein
MQALLFPGVLLLAAIVAAAGAWIVGAPRRGAFLRELVVVVFAYFAYFLVRGLTEGDVDTALANARALVSFESSVGISVGPETQQAIAAKVLLIDVANAVYAWGHWPVIGIVAIWLYHRQLQSYRFYRTAFLISGGIGLVLFFAFPTAPPRLADMGFIDTVSERADVYRILQPPQLTNQYAAFPSLHFGWNLLIGIALVSESRHFAARLFGAVLPIAMAVAIVATANHYVVDGIAGAAVALAGLAISRWFYSWRGPMPEPQESNRETVDRASGRLASAIRARKHRL